MMMEESRKRIRSDSESDADIPTLYVSVTPPRFKKKLKADESEDLAALDASGGPNLNDAILDEIVSVGKGQGMIGFWV